jgi:hypothetical protein
VIRGFDSPIIPILWYYPDGTQCSTKHELISVRDEEGDIIGLKCETTGLEVHSIVREVERLQALAPTHVYIAEVIFSGDNPWDGRTRYGVCLSLEDALDSLSSFAKEGMPLVATPREETDDPEFWDEDGPIRWMVHRPDEGARWDGHLWIFKERVWTR